MQSVFLLVAVLALTVYGQLTIKSRALVHVLAETESQGKLHYLVTMFMDVWVLSALAAGVIAAVCWMLVVTRLGVGYAYPFMALSFVFVPLGSMILFGEPLPRVQLFALGLIVAGVTLSALSR